MLNRFARQMFTPLLVTLVAVLVVWGFSAAPTWAAGLLPACAESGDCSLCDIVGVFINFAALIVEWLGLLAVLLFIIGGIFIIMGGANAEWVKRGRQILVGTIIGSVLVVSGWLIVNFTLAALLNADFDSVQIFPTSYTDEVNPSGGDDWYELACNPVYQDCAAAEDGSSCSTSACGTNCVCSAGSCTSYCQFLEDVGTFSDTECETSASNCTSGYSAISYWCPLNSAYEEQVCCVPPATP